MAVVNPPRSTRPRRGVVLVVTLLAFLALVFVAVVTVLLLKVELDVTAPLDLSLPDRLYPRSDLSFANCTMVLSAVSSTPAQPAENSGVISRDRAAQIADTVLARYVTPRDGKPYDNAAGPELLLASLPGEGQQPVWARLWIRPGGNVNYGQNAVVVYLNAQTGEPLALFTDITVIDPVFAGCDNRQFMSAADILNETLPFVLGALAILLVLGVIGLWWGLRKIKESLSQF